MNDSDLDTYSRVQLRDIAKHIDRDKFPERYAKIKEILNRPGHVDPPEETEEEIHTRREFDSWMDWISVEIMIFLFILLMIIIF